MGMETGQNIHFYSFAPQGDSVDSVDTDTAAFHGSDRSVCG